MNKKGKTIMVATTVVLAILIFGILTNSHIDIFPGNTLEYDVVSGQDVSGKGLISLLDHRRPGGNELTFFGYVIAFLVVIVGPLGVGYFAGDKFGDK